MVKKSVVDYVKSMLGKGYNSDSIRQNMIKYGYSESDVNEAIKEAYNPTIRHEIHFSKTAVFLIVLVVAAIIGTGAFFYFGSNQGKSTGQLLDVNLEGVTTSAKPGEDIVFVKELSNLGSETRFDVTVKQEIIEAKTYKLLTQKTETRAIETFGSTQTKIEIPEDAKPGDYLLRVTVEYENKKALATLPIKVMPSGSAAKQESCFDGIKNQDEEETDCGGQCSECEGQASCDDSNPCTNEVIDGIECSNEPIVPCCGNGVCEESEECNEDCGKISDGFDDSGDDNYEASDLDEIAKLAKSNPIEAGRKCNENEVPDLKDSCISTIAETLKDKSYCTQINNQRIKDLCYSGIAKSTNQPALCELISTDSRKDSCYMIFVLENKDYTVCEKLRNKYQRQSCESLRQIDEINSKQ